MFMKLVFAFLTIKSLEGLTSKQTANERLSFFDIDLLRYAAEDRPGNVVISPASIKSVLGMLLEGAAGKTAMEIMSALRVAPNKDEYREQLNVYLTALKMNSTKTQLEIANGLFVSDKHILKKEYGMMLKNVYLSEIYKTNFVKSVQATENINNWVKNKTKGLIPNIVEPNLVSPSTDVLLANAIYFKSAWRHTFNPRMTRSACFYNHGICRNVAMMELQAELKYAYIENLRSHAVELPYEDQKYSMILLVPQDKLGWSTLVRDLPYMSLPQISALMFPTDLELSLPKFSVDYSEDMVPVLQSMKIKELFTASANLTNIFEGHLPQVNNVYHKVHLEVSEEGTVAAAVTGALVIPLIGDRVTLTVDRPFLFFIRDNELGIVLFEGKIEEPSSFVAQTQNGVPDTNIKRTGPPKKGTKS